MEPKYGKLNQLTNQQQENHNMYHYKCNTLKLNICRKLKFYFKVKDNSLSFFSKKFIHHSNLQLIGRGVYS